MLNWLFWGALFLTLYTYIIFPVTLVVLVKIGRRKDETSQKKHAGTLRVAVLCAMYNEEKVVRKKIENFLKLNYEGLRLYIGSDGSSDATNAILREYTNDRIVIREYPRRGKVHVINDLMTEAEEDIIVFTDANSMFEADAVGNLVKRFDDPGIGAVCGRLKLVCSGRITGEGFYWRYETAIKKLENALDCVIGANGAIYAVRKTLLRPLPVNTINDDFINSMRVLEKGYGVKYADDAIACEEVHQNDAIEFNRHTRDGAGHYRAIVYLYKLLNPLNPKVFFLYVSHRVIRWFVPFFMLVMLFLPLFMEQNRFVQAVYAAEVAFYVLVLIAWTTQTKQGFFYFPYYFVYINIALFLGFWRTVLGMQKTTWNRTER